MPVVGAEVVITKGQANIIYSDDKGNKEIWEGGSRSWRNHNPGNLRNHSKAIAKDRGGFCIFPDEETGRSIQVNVLKNKYGSYDSISQMLAGKFDTKGHFIAGSGYAPKCDKNDPVGYAKFIHSKTGFDVAKTPMKSFNDDQLGKIVDAMKKQEGFKVGMIVPLPGVKPQIPAPSAH